MSHSPQSPQSGPASSAEWPALGVAFLDALEAGARPDAWLRRYPEHAAALIDLAQAYALEQAAPAPTPAEVAAVAAIARRTLAAARPEPVLGLSARASRAGLTLRALAARVGLGSDVLVKIDRRVVRPETVPGALVRELAAILDCTAAALRAGLQGAAPAAGAAMYHAKQTPAVGQQSFADAVAASMTTAPEARARWLQAAAADSGEP